MGFFDRVTNGFHRGSEAVGRTTESARLTMKADELLRKRKDLAAQLGAALYDQTRNDAHLRQGREALYDGIAEIDAQRASIEDRLAELERMANIARQDSMSYRCPSCGNTVFATDSFCIGCGMPIAEIRAAYTSNGQSIAGGASCPNCGAPVNPDDQYCMTCGSPIVSAEVPAFDSDISDVKAPDKEYYGTPASTSSQSLNESSTVNCPQCGNPLKPQDVFCGKCGFRLS